MAFFGRIGGKFPYTNWQNLNLDWILSEVQNALNEWAQYHAQWDEWKDDTNAAFNSLRSYVMNYFQNLDVDEEINEKLEAMADDGSLNELIDPLLPGLIAAWLAEHITPTTPAVDNTLTISGAAADSKTVGDRLRLVDQTINSNKELGKGNIATPTTPRTFTSSGLTITIDADGWVTVTGTSTGNVVFDYWTETNENLTKGETYSVILASELVMPRMMQYKNGQASQIVSTGYPFFNYPLDADYIQLRLSINSGVTIDEKVRPYLVQNKGFYDSTLKQYDISGLTYQRFYSSGGGTTPPFSVDGSGSPYYTAQTRKIPVVLGSILDFTIEFDEAVDVWVAVTYLDENGDFIKRLAPILTGNNTGGHIRIAITEEETKYIAFSFRSYKATRTCKVTLLTNTSDTDADYLDPNVADAIGNTYDPIVFPYWYINASGGYSNGTGKRDCFSSKIPVRPGDKIIPHLVYSEAPPAGTTTGMWIGAVLYDANDDFIQREIICNYEDILEYNRHYTVENSQAAYICFTFRGYFDDINSTFEIIKNGRVNNNEEAIDALNEELEQLIEGYHPYGERANYIVKSINHRGYNVTAPENTLPAFRLSKQKGFKYVETDVALTSDNVPVLLHDDTINRTARNADGTPISQTININSITYDQALSYDFGVWKSAIYAGTKIPTLAQFLKLCKVLSLHPYLELKGSITTQAQIDSIIEIIKTYGMINNVTFISYGWTLLEYVLNSEPTARIGLTSSTLSTDAVTWINSHKTSSNKIFANISLTGITDAIVQTCIENDIELEAWATTITTEQVTAMNSYITGLTCNNLVAGDVLITTNIGDSNGLSV